MSPSPKTQTLAIPSAEAALVAYGHREENGMFIRGQKEAWQRNPNGAGWLRFDPPTVATPFTGPGIADPAPGQPWGVVIPELGWAQVPYKPAEKWSAVSGLHPAVHPECFDFVWPEEIVAEMYALAQAAAVDGENRYARQDDGSLVRV